MNTVFTRRSAVIGAASLAILPVKLLAKVAASDDPGGDLANDFPLGFMGNYDADNLGPPADRSAKSLFVFPRDAESATAYGIDISHHTKEVPWAALKDARVNYVYMKASQALKRDATLPMHWKSAKDHNMPRGAFLWLTPGVSGKEQGEWFVSRLVAAGGLESGDLQPVIDLEWDYLGKDFKKTVISKIVIKGKEVAIYKDYWEDHSSDAISKEVLSCVDAIKAGFPNLKVSPIIYTNLSWWENRIAKSVRFPCSIWPSDYRSKSYDAGVPRTVIGHDYNMWQFTDKGMIEVDGKRQGPFDCNKLVSDGIEKLRIS